MNEYTLSDHQIRVFFKQILTWGGQNQCEIDYLFSHFSPNNIENAKKVFSELVKEGKITGNELGFFVWGNSRQKIDPFKKKGYCQRLREFLQDGNFSSNDYIIIDYPLEETITVKFFLDEVKTINYRLINNNVEIRLIKADKYGLLVAYHFND